MAYDSRHSLQFDEGQQSGTMQVQLQQDVWWDYWTFFVGGDETCFQAGKDGTVRVIELL
jgi:hypothetical protein